MSVRAISYLETGRTRAPLMRTIRLLAAALNVRGEQYQRLREAAREPSRGPRQAVTPRQLPAAPAHFTGRAAELAALSAALSAGLAEPAGQGRSPVVAVIGTAGVGKTALALHWAHQMSDRFPDGQLYLNLRGFDPAGPPATPAECVGTILTALRADHIPDTLTGQVGLYRSLVAGKRLLVVLDNARDEQQIRPLLPGTGGGAVLVTSRTDLTGLAAADGARLLNLDVLPADLAAELLTRRLGVAPDPAGTPAGDPAGDPAGTLAGDPAAIGEIAGLCAGLPLALTVAAARAAARPDRPLAALAAELRDARDRLDALATTDVTCDVRAVLACSIRQLTEPARRMFTLLGLHPGPAVSARVAASLAGVPTARALAALHELARMHLLTEHPAGRFWMHDLLRAYAAEQAHLPHGSARRRAATERMLDHYVRSAGTASAALNPFRIAASAQPPHAGLAAGDSRQALTWFDTERDALLAMIGLAQARLDHAQACQLGSAMADYLDWQGRWRELSATQQAALAAADQLGDTARQADAHRSVGRAALRLASFETATWHLSEALRLYGLAGERVPAARVELDLGHASERRGRYADALGHSERALRQLAGTDDHAGQANALNDIGWCHAKLGDVSAAMAFLNRALRLHRELDYTHGEAATLDSLGYTHYVLGQPRAAIRYFEQSAALYQEVGDRASKAEPLTHLGDALRARGSRRLAGQAWHEALAILDDLSQPDAEHLRVRLYGLRAR